MICFYLSNWIRVHRENFHKHFKNVSFPNWMLINIIYSWTLCSFRFVCKLVELIKKNLMSVFSLLIFVRFNFFFSEVTLKWNSFAEFKLYLSESKKSRRCSVDFKIKSWSFFFICCSYLFTLTNFHWKVIF